MISSGPKVYADFHNADSQGRLRLTCIRTLEDLSRQKIKLCEGLRLTVYADDLDAQGQLDELHADAVVTFSNEEHCWIATIDWDAISHSSHSNRSNDNGSGAGLGVPALRSQPAPTK